MTSKELPRHDREITRIIELLDAVDRGEHGVVTPLPEREVLARINEKADRDYVIALAAAADERRRDSEGARATRWTEEAERLARERQDQGQDQRLVQAAAALAIGYAAPRQPSQEVPRPQSERQQAPTRQRSDWQKAARYLAATTGDISPGDVAPNLSPIHPVDLTEPLEKGLRAAAKCSGKLASSVARRGTQRFRGPSAIDVAAKMEANANSGAEREL